MKQIAKPLIETIEIINKGNYDISQEQAILKSIESLRTIVFKIDFDIFYKQNIQTLNFFKKFNHCNCEECRKVMDFKFPN